MRSSKILTPFVRSHRCSGSAAGYYVAHQRWQYIHRPIGKRRMELGAALCTNFFYFKEAQKWQNRRKFCSQQLRFQRPSLMEGRRMGAFADMLFEMENTASLQTGAFFPPILHRNTRKFNEKLKQFQSVGFIGRPVRVFANLD